jgi:iduronate 2-sulfatase
MQAVCAPSRNALLTGLRPEVLRIYDLGTNFRKSTPDVVTLPQWFKQHGYASHGVGKIFHVGTETMKTPASWSVPHFHAKTIGYVLPENRAKLTREEALFANAGGEVSKLPRGAAYENADVADDAYADGRIREREHQAAAGFQEVREHRSSWPSDSCARICLSVRPKKYWDLHDPSKFPLAERTTPPDGAPKFAPQSSGELRQYATVPDQGAIEPELQRKLIHGYYASTSYMDAQLGRVLDELEKLGLAENTIVILWGDHGWHLGDHGMWCKHTNYEQATHAPLLISAPGKRTSQRTRALVEFVDIYPTLCELAGLEKPTHLQGESLVPIIDAPSTKREAAFQVYPRVRRKLALSSATPYGRTMALCGNGGRQTKRVSRRSCMICRAIRKRR